MSGNSKDPDLSSNKPENTTLNEPKKKEKKNYCDVCQVQCSGNKNFLEHGQGKKHQKRLSTLVPFYQPSQCKTSSSALQATKNATRTTKKKNLRNILKNKKSIKIVTDNKSKNRNNVNSKDSGEIKAMSSHSNGNSFEWNTLLKRRKNPNDMNVGNMAPNLCDRQKYNYPSSYNPNLPYQPFSFNRKYKNYPSWNDFQNPRPGLLEAPNFYTNFGYNHTYNFNLSQSTYNPDFNSYQIFDKNAPLIQKPSLHNENDSTKRNKPESEKSKLNSTFNFNNCSIPSTSTNVSKNTSSARNYSSALGADVCAEASKAFQEISTQREQTSGEKKQLHSSDLTSSQNASHNENSKKDENQNPDSGGQVDHQKIKDWTNSLLETNHGQISRLIHPSNYKDKAVVSHLITNLSKSRRKETRLKFRSNSLCSSGTNDEDDNDEDKVTESVEAECDMLNLREGPLTQDNINVEKNILYSSDIKNSKGSTVKNIDSESCDATLDKMQKKPAKSRNNVAFPSHKKSYKIRDQSDMNADAEKAKRKKNYCTGNRSKKRKSLDVSMEEIIAGNYNQQNLGPSVTEDQSLTNNTNFEKVINIPDIANVKEEVLPNSQEENPAETSTANTSLNSQPLISDNNFGFSINTLIKLFASGSVTVVKNEFNDPVLEALKALDPNILMNACSSKSSSSNQSNSGSPLILEPSVQGRPEPHAIPTTEKEGRNCMSPVTLGSTVINDGLPLGASGQGNNSGLNPVTMPSEDQSCSSFSASTNDNNSICDVNDIDFMPKNKSEYTPHLKKLIKQLREITSIEETVKQSLQETKCKIGEYQQLLEEWKNKKKNLQEREEDLRKQRINIIELMQSAVKITNENSSTEREITSSPKSKNLSLEPEECPVQSSILEENSIANDTELTSNQKSNKVPLLSDTEEILIVPVKSEEPELIVIEDDNSNENLFSGSENLRDCSGASSNVPSIFDKKHLDAHQTVVNCLQVFGDFLYTCSNDSTGKRFHLKNLLETVTYLHSSKNVLEIVVEKVQSEALVLTSCSNIISLFIASNGTKIKIFFQPSAIMSICKGWGKFFCGLANGTVNAYNWKYEEIQIVISEHSASRIATAHQGRLHVLIILSSNGNISVIDAETGLLIRYIKGCVKLPSWLTVHNDLAYLSSSDKTLTILDIMTGRAEKKLYVSSHTTGLAVYEDYIFTISYTGLVNCYNKRKLTDNKMYYGAGKNGLTCICMYQDWVFTGNRKGHISIFKFDSSITTCQFSNCCYRFGLVEDLAFHLEKDHIMRRKNISKCSWGICNVSFPSSWDVEDKLQHIMEKHILEEKN